MHIFGIFGAKIYSLCQFCDNAVAFSFLQKINIITFWEQGCLCGWLEVMTLKT